jgi:hypothetical protein
MKQQADDVMSCRVLAEQLDIEHVGNPVQKLGEIILEVKRPNDTFPGQPPFNVDILDIKRIIKVNELKENHLPEN